MLVSIQIIRAAAALLVVYYHAMGFGGVGNPAFQFGDFGVDIFFVLSGFIMWFTTARLDRRIRPSDFLSRRSARIVPIYWIFTLLTVLLFVLSPALLPSTSISPATVVLSLFFIPHYYGLEAAGSIEPVLRQGWTLNYEMFFYFVFCVSLFWSAATRRLIVISSVLCICVLLGFLFRPRSAILYSYTNSILLEFLLGVAIARWSQLGGRMAPVTAAALVAVGITCLFLVRQNAIDDTRFLRYGVPGALLVWGVLGFEPWLRRHPPTFLVRIGDASYSMYLSHTFVLKGCAVALSWMTRRASLSLPGRIPLALSFALVGIMASIVFAVACYALLEQPIARYLGALLRRKQDIKLQDIYSAETP